MKDFLAPSPPQRAQTAEPRPRANSARGIAAAAAERESAYMTPLGSQSARAHKSRNIRTGTPGNGAYHAISATNWETAYHTWGERPTKDVLNPTAYRNVLDEACAAKAARVAAQRQADKDLLNTLSERAEESAARRVDCEVAAKQRAAKSLIEAWTAVIDRPKGDNFDELVNNDMILPSYTLKDEGHDAVHQQRRDNAKSYHAMLDAQMAQTERVREEQEASFPAYMRTVKPREPRTRAPAQIAFPDMSLQAAGVRLNPYLGKQP